MSYTHLSLSERVQIKVLIEEGYKKSEVAKRLGRHRSTITRELAIWGIKNNLQERIKDYDPELAHWCSLQNKGIVKKYEYKLKKNNNLLILVKVKLKLRWSPQQISAWLKIKYPSNKTMHVSHETIYQFIYNVCNSILKEELISYLRRNKKKRKSNVGSLKRKMKIKDRVSIHNRPQKVEDRKEIGHWEGDLMISKNKKHAIGTLVERNSRFTIIVKPKSRSSQDVVNAFIKAFKAIPKDFKKSLTYDNGMEMAKHKSFSKSTGMDVFFCDPYSSWQRGTNENTNGLIRDFWNKNTFFEDIPLKEIKRVQSLLNDRPRKILNWRSPKQVFDGKGLICP